MAKQTMSSSFMSKPRIKRKGVHAKSKTSSNPGSKNYKKPLNRGGN
jgi:hypothetical protein